MLRQRLLASIYARSAVIYCFVLPLLFPGLPLCAEEIKRQPGITLPWEYHGEQPNKSYRMLNRIGNAVAAIDYHPVEDLWLLSLTRKTGKQPFARLDAVNVFIRGQGFVAMESPLDCSDCVEKRDGWSSIHVPLTDADLQLLGEGFYLDFHYDKAGVPDEENGFVFRVGLIEASEQIEKIMESVPSPVPLQATEFIRGRIWLLRYNATFRKKRQVVDDKQLEIGQMKQKENKNWYSGISYAGELPEWAYVVRELGDGEETLVLVKR